MKKDNEILFELRKHLPFTLIASLAAGFLVAIFYLLGRVPSEELFEIVHPAHVMVSAVATSAIYWRYHRVAGRRSQVAEEWMKTILVGVGGAILIGSLSDVLLPFLAGNLFSLDTHFHLPIIENPFLILSVAIIGAGIGMVFDFFRTGHLIHVFLSVFASLFYLLAFSVEVTFLGVLMISGLVFLCVLIPCCISDIVFPLLFVGED